jgi:hypothetical protein
LSLPTTEAWCYRRLRPVNIAGILRKLPDTRFVDTGGPNGWLAKPAPEWLRPFIETVDPGVRYTWPMIRKLPPFQNLPPHIDNFRNTPNLGMRRHVPLVSHPDVKMRWPEAGVEVWLEPGYLWEVQYDILHEVVHRAPIDRIHLHYNVVS